MLVAYDIFKVSFALSDVNGRLVGCDAVYLDLLGHTRESVRGLTAAHATHPDDRGDYLAMMKCVAESGQPVIVKKRSLRRDGSVIWVQNRLTIFHGLEPQVMVASRQIDPPRTPERNPGSKTSNPRAYANYAADLASQLAGMCEQAGLDLSADLLDAASRVAPIEGESVVWKPGDLN